MEYITKPPSNKYILYAEDDKDDQAFFTEILKITDSSIDLVTVNNGVEVLDFLGRLPGDAPLPCLILLDINMPVLDGYDTIKKLYSNHRFQSISVIFFSTASSQLDQGRAFALGAKRYVTKPLSVNAMIAICESLAQTCHSESDACKSQER